MIKRAVLTVALFLSAFLFPVQAQQAAKVPHVGFVSPVGRTAPLVDQFRKALADLGYVDGQNIAIEPRYADGQYDRFPAFGTDLANQKVDAIALVGAVTARGIRKTAGDIPIIFAIVVDPVKDDVVSNVQRPGGNITGVTTFDPQQPRKQLELLKEAIPGIKRVAVLGDTGISEALISASEEQGRALGLEIQRIRIGGENPDIEGAFASIRQKHADAVLELEEPVLGINSRKIAEIAARERLPLMVPPTRAANGLLGYGTSLPAGLHRMAEYVDKILKGAKPGDLPVETVTRYELIVNLKAARDIGITVPPDVIKRADRVIQ
jgi:ABC-type uncharacterized transport system substrate-binding protein